LINKRIYDDDDAARVATKTEGRHACWDEEQLHWFRSNHNTTKRKVKSLISFNSNSTFVRNDGTHCNAGPK